MANTLRENVLLAEPPKRVKRAVGFSKVYSTMLIIKCS